MSKRLDDRLVKSLPAPANGASITYDSDLPGFGIRVTSSGARSFILNYRINGRERRYTIGSAAEWKAAAARKYAAELKAKVRLGEDPLGALEERRQAPMMTDLCDRFEEEHLPRLRPASQELYRAALHGSKSRKGIRDYFKHTRVSEIRHSDVDAYFRYVSRTAPSMANRAHAVLSRMLGLAVKWDWRADNPARGIEKNPENKRERYLSPDEIARLSRALTDYEDQQAADVFRFLLLTGARRGETLAARWEDMDLDRRVWVKPGHTTKRKTTHRVPLSEAAVRLLEGIPRTSEWVFPGRFEGTHRMSLDRPWRTVCKAAGIKDMRVHDLRHTHASILVSAGLSLPIIGALLGHTQPQTTARYAHLMDDPLRQATERAAAIVTGASSAQVVSLGRAK